MPDAAPSVGPAGVKHSTLLSSLEGSSFVDWSPIFDCWTHAHSRSCSHVTGRYTFPCNKWLAKTKGDKLLQRELPVQKTDPTTKNGGALQGTVTRYDVRVYTTDVRNAGINTNMLSCCTRLLPSVVLSVVPSVVPHLVLLFSPVLSFFYCGLIISFLSSVVLTHALACADISLQVPMPTFSSSLLEKMGTLAR